MLVDKPKLYRNLIYASVRQFKHPLLVISVTTVSLKYLTSCTSKMSK